MSDEQLPKLRPVNPRWLQFEGQRLLHIQDPLGLSDKTIIVPHSVAPLLGLLDGARNLDEVRAAFLLRSSSYLTPNQIEALIDNLDQALLLDNRRFRNALQEAVDAYRSGPFRKPAFSGGAYEEDPDALLEALDGYCDTAKSEAQAGPGALVGLISPHVDYPRGWRTYAETWSRAREAAEQADLVILFGTDHGGAPNSLTLTRQSYATPWGTLPTDVPLVDRLAPLLGEEQAFAQEVHHINEHSIELAAVWLHYIAGRQPKPLLPVLCGPPGRKPSDIEDDTQDDTHDGVSGPPQDFLKALADIAAGPRVLVVAAADLSHVGPAFGDPAPWTPRPRKASMPQTWNGWRSPVPAAAPCWQSTSVSTETPPGSVAQAQSTTCCQSCKSPTGAWCLTSSVPPTSNSVPWFRWQECCSPHESLKRAPSPAQLASLLPRTRL